MFIELIIGYIIGSIATLFIYSLMIVAGQAEEKSYYK